MKATAGIELLLRLDRASSVSLRVQLEQQLRDAVRTGTLRRGTPLPATRTLAAELAVARNVVTDAYSQLVAECYLVGRQGAATRVAELARPQEEARPQRQVEDVWRFDFRSGAPDVSLFPRRAWAEAVAQALREAPDARFGYGDPRGTPELRSALAQYLGRVRGVAADPASIVVTSGVAQGLALVCRALRAGGVRFLGVEEPGSGPVLEQVSTVGLTAVPVQVDGDGVHEPALRASEAEALLVTPAHQFPTGVVLSPARRAGVLSWAAERDAFVFEDDYDAEYRYDRAPIGALQGLNPDRVVYAGSVSKTLAPALRLGWLVVPDALRAAVLHEKANDDRATPLIEQLGLALLLERGEVDRHLRRSRPIYRRRRDQLTQALARHMPDARPEGEAAGLHVLVHLPSAVDEAAVVERARTRGVRVTGLAEHRMRPGGPALVLGYGRIQEAAIERGIRELAAAVSDDRRPVRPRRREAGRSHP
ncbi:MAG: PLP-dependent aminotransferase family protein [Solirubrobacteraceae bacterium]